MKKIEIDLDVNTGSSNKDINKIKDGIQDIPKATKAAEKGVNKFSTSLKNIGKVSGVVFLLTQAFEILKDTFSKNQKIVDIFNTGMEALSLVFNDLFAFLNNNIGTVVDYFKAIFNDPQQALKDLGVAIQENIVERFNSALEVFGYVGKAIKKLFKGDWKGAMEEAKNAGKEYIDVLTGVDGTFDKIAETTIKVVNATIDYTKSTIKSAQSIVALNKAAEVGAAQNRLLIEQYDRQSELQRQIRDDETRPMEDRIAANEKLGELLLEQEKLMISNVDNILKASTAQYEKNASDENQLILLDALTEKEGVLAQLTGLKSEQLTNINSLQREADEQEIERKQELIDLENQRRQGIMDSLDAVRTAAGEETKIGKALFLLKIGMILKEQILGAQATMQDILNSSVKATVDGQVGFMKAAAAAPPPANIPLIALFGIQAAGIAMSIKKAVSTARSMVGSKGGAAAGGSMGSISAPSTPQAPAFNIVGASGNNQLAQIMGKNNKQPLKTFVVSQEVSTAQALQRNIIDGASIG